MQRSRCRSRSGQQWHRTVYDAGWTATRCSAGSDGTTWHVISRRYGHGRRGRGRPKGSHSEIWAMRNDRQRERQLPGFFNREVYEILDGAAEVEAEEVGEEEEEGKKALAVEEEEDDDEEEEAIFDCGLTAADDGLFSDFK